jgi:hypothetical protein
LGSGARIRRVVNKAMSGFPVTISVISGSGVCYCPRSASSPWRFPVGRVEFYMSMGRLSWRVPLFLKINLLTAFTRISVFSVSLPWRWNRPFVARLLPIQIFPLVEHRLPTPGFGTYQRRDEAHQLRLLLFLQFAPHTRRDGFNNYRAGHG